MQQHQPASDQTEKDFEMATHEFTPVGDQTNARDRLRLELGDTDLHIRMDLHLRVEMIGRKEQFAAEGISPPNGSWPLGPRDHYSNRVRWQVDGRDFTAGIAGRTLIKQCFGPIAAGEYLWVWIEPAQRVAVDWTKVLLEQKMREMEEIVFRRTPEGEARSARWRRSREDGQFQRRLAALIEPTKAPGRIVRRDAEMG